MQKPKAIVKLKCRVGALACIVLGLLPCLAVAQNGAHYPLVNGDQPPALSLPSAIGPILYTPGRGLHVGETGLTLGGYSNANLVRDEGRPAELKLDDISAFVMWNPLPRLRLFSELEGEDLVTVNSNGEGGTVNRVFTLERLYGDIQPSDRLELRIGKFLTPVGRWNVIHAQPLTWTTSRPLATVVPFDRHTTGAMLSGSLYPKSGTLTYSAFGQFVNQLVPATDEVRPAGRSGGARLEYWARHDWSAGTTYLAFTHDGHWLHLGGADVLWHRGATNVMGEVVYEDGSGKAASLWGLYIQGVLRVRPRVYVVGRYEHFDLPGSEPEVNLIVPGLVYKPLPYLVLKAEYLIADHRAEESPPGFKSSIAVLF